MKIGFTGTQKGMSESQKASLDKLFELMTIDEFHHGDCIGADEQAHQQFASHNKLIVIHPPLIKDKRAFCKHDKLEMRYERDYISRNHAIVEETEVLIATPYEFDEQLRSGTWATVRHARKLKKEIFIIYPDGSINE